MTTQGLQAMRLQLQNQQALALAHQEVLRVHLPGMWRAAQHHERSE